MPLAQTVVAQKGMFAAHSALASLATKLVLQALHWGVAVEAMVVMVAQLGTLAWQRKASVVSAGNSLRSTVTGHWADHSATRRAPFADGTVSRCSDVKLRSYPSANVTGLSAPKRGGCHAGGGASENDVVGCDGASSTVRDGLGVPLLGEGALANSINIFFRSPELVSLHEKGWARIYRSIDEEGCWSELIPIDGAELWRLTVFDDGRYEHDPQAALRRMAGMEFPHEIISTLVWERRDSVADRYQSGRVLIAGDSAHQSSPTGGAGMHTGMEEAVNLAWKLEATLKGWGGARLLASYEAERRPIAQRNIDLSTVTYKALRSIPQASRADQETAWKTTTLPKYSIPDHVRSCPVLVDSPIIVDDGSPALPVAPPQPMPSSRPGARAPHAWLAPDRSTIDLFGEGFVLLRFGDGQGDTTKLLEAASARGVPMREVVVKDREAARLYEQPLVLVRPDYHVAWRGARAPDHPDAIVDRIRGA